jgi:hypothetical protein
MNARTLDPRLIASAIVVVMVVVGEAEMMDLRRCRIVDYKLYQIIDAYAVPKFPTKKNLAVKPLTVLQN